MAKIHGDKAAHKMDKVTIVIPITNPKCHP